MMIVQAPDIERRPPVCYLTYRRDVTTAIQSVIDGGAAFGPTTMGEALWPVEAVFDEATGRTHVGLSYIAPAAVTS